MKKSYYATDYLAGDAFIAGHIGEWVEGHKTEMTKNQLVHLVAILNQYWINVAENNENPDKMARHLNLIFSDINNKIKENW